MEYLTFTHHKNAHPFFRAVLWYCLIILCSLGIGVVLEHGNVFTSFDRYFYTHINSLPHNSFINTLIYPFDLWFFPLRPIFFMPAFFYFLFVPFFLIMYLFKRADLLFSFITLCVALAFAAVLLFFDSFFVFRERPYTALPHHVDAVTQHILKGITSYPSGHTRDTAVSCTVMQRFLPKLTWFFIFFTLFIGFLRVYTGEHYPTDVVFGAIYGFFIAKVTISMREAQRRRKRIHEEK